MAKIDQNTTGLQNILDLINNLPTDGGGSEITDGTGATANDIANGKTAYVNNTKIMGTLHEVSGGSSSTPTILTNYSYNLIKYGDYVFTIYGSIPKDKIIRNGYVGMSIYKDAMGTATVDQVLSGTTFTSTNGLKLTGTIETKSNNDISVNGATITVPSGYYANEMNKSVATVTQATPSISIDSSGLITASVTQSAGYVSAGTKEATKTIPTETKTITENGTYTPSSGKYFSSVTVNTPVGYKSGDVVKATSVSLTLGTSYMSARVTYGTSIVNTNGTLSLEDSTSVTASSASDLDVVKGKYVQISSTIYYIPTDASITHTGTTYNKSYTSDKANPVFVIA